MTGNDAAGIFNIAATLPHGFEKVSVNAKDTHDGTKDYTMVKLVAKEACKAQDKTGKHGREYSTPETNPGLLGRDLREEFLAILLAKGDSEYVSAYIRCPDNDEEAQHQLTGELCSVEYHKV